MRNHTHKHRTLFGKTAKFAFTALAAITLSPAAIAQSAVDTIEPVAACTLSAEELKDPHSFVRIDQKYAVIAWWALHGRDNLPRIVEWVGNTHASEVWTNWTIKGKIKNGKPNRYGVKSDAKVYKAMKKYKKIPWDRIDMYPAPDAVKMITKTFGDCFGERSAALDFKEIGLVRGDFSADFCNAAAAMPEINGYGVKSEYKPFQYWAANQINYHSDQACGYVPDMAFDWALENDAAGKEAAQAAADAAHERILMQRASGRATMDAMKAYNEGAAQRAAYVAEERAKHAAEEQARQAAADAAYNNMITNSQNQIPTPPTNNERRCYDQGDGTEKCFYD